MLGCETEFGMGFERAAAVGIVGCINTEHKAPECKNVGQMFFQIKVGKNGGGEGVFEQKTILFAYDAFYIGFGVDVVHSVNQHKITKLEDVCDL